MTRFSNLHLGKYIVKEKWTPIDYEVAVDFTFSITYDKQVIKKDSTIEFTFEKIEVPKTEAESKIKLFDGTESYYLY